jgi:hypothetical protein
MCTRRISRDCSLSSLFVFPAALLLWKNGHTLLCCANYILIPRLKRLFLILINASHHEPRTTSFFGCSENCKNASQSFNVMDKYYRGMFEYIYQQHETCPKFNSPQTTTSPPCQSTRNSCIAAFACTDLTASRDIYRQYCLTFASPPALLPTRKP